MLTSCQMMAIILIYTDGENLFIVNSKHNYPLNLCINQIFILFSKLAMFWTSCIIRSIIYMTLIEERCYLDGRITDNENEHA